MTKKLLAKYHQIEIVDVLNSIIRAIIRELEQETLGNRRIFRCAKCRFKRAVCLGGKCYALSKSATAPPLFASLMLKGKESKAELRSKSFDPTNDSASGLYLSRHELFGFFFSGSLDCSFAYSMFFLPCSFSL